VNAQQFSIPPRDGGNQSPPSPPLRRGDFECVTCGLMFGGVGAFDLHRTGTLTDRRCLSASELPAKGLALGARGRWGRGYDGAPRLRARPRRPVAA
jgi:hypothetical protein